MDMSGMNMSATTSAMPTSTGMAMGNHTMSDMHMGGCKMEMYWNWYTVGTCFLAKSWHITSNGMFAGSCIGVICLVLSLEFLRRAGREYDSFIIRKARLRQSFSPALLGNNTCDITCPGAENDFGTPVDTPKQATSAPPTSLGRCSTPYRPSLMEHTIRSLFHMIQFAVAYFIMLLAMYYNGYIIICIFIGAFLGAFIFAWEPVDLAKESDSMSVTKCCG